MRKHITLGLAVLASLLLIGGVAVASIPDSSGVIHGCRKTSDGTLRVIDSATTPSCPNGFVPLNWSQTGPAGPAGPTGPAGPQGPAGTAGWQVLRTTVAAVHTDAGVWLATGALTCPSGMFAVSGGYTYAPVSNPAGVKALEDGPRSFALAGGALPAAWEVTVEADAAGSVEIDATCATVGS